MYNELWFAHTESRQAGKMQPKLVDCVMTMIKEKLKTSRLKSDDDTVTLIFERINQQWQTIKPTNGPTGVAALYTAHISSAMLQRMRAQR